MTVRKFCWCAADGVRRVNQADPPPPNPPSPPILLTSKERREIVRSGRVPYLKTVRTPGSWSIIHILYNVTSAIHYTAKNQYRKLETNILRKGIGGHSPNFHIHVSVSDLLVYVPTIHLPILLLLLILGIYI